MRVAIPDDGSGSLLAIAGAALLAAGAMVSWAVVDLVGAHQRAAVAADLAALAGAPFAGVAPDEACRRAAVVLERNDAVGIDCIADGDDLIVTAGSRPRGIARMLSRGDPLARATARAGPAGR